MNWYQKFAFLMVGVFSATATLTMVSFTYILYTQWQGSWSGSFDDLKSISGAIVKLEKSAQPISEIAPKIVDQMAQVNRNLMQIRMAMEKTNQTVEKMEQDIRGIDVAVKGINRSVYGLSGTVPHRLDTIRNKINPWRIMSPFN